MCVVRHSAWNLFSCSVTELCFPFLQPNQSKIITVNATLFPTSIANSLIAVGTDGLQERDRMVRAAIAIICELGKNKLGKRTLVVVFKVLFLRSH